MMTEREAWLRLHELWSKPRLDAVCPYVEYDGQMFAGICGTINGLLGTGEISIATSWARLKPKINKLLEGRTAANDSNYPYLFPRTPEGAKRRAEFCLARANELPL